MSAGPILADLLDPGPGKPLVVLLITIPALAAVAYLIRWCHLLKACRTHLPAALFSLLVTAGGIVGVGVWLALQLEYGQRGWTEGGLGGGNIWWFLLMSVGVAPVSILIGWLVLEFGCRSRRA